jgi:hypothetical protein
MPTAFRSCPHKKASRTLLKQPPQSFFLVGQKIPAAFVPSEYVYSRKLDGIRIRIVHGKHIVTRSGVVLSHLRIPSSYQSLQEYVVDAELIYKDPDATTSYKVMKHLHDASVLHMCPFSIVGKTILESITFLQQIPGAVTYYKVPTYRTLEWMKKTLERQSLWEGIVCRSMTVQVREGKRLSRACFKVKRSLFLKKKRETS